MMLKRYIKKKGINHDIRFARLLGSTLTYGG